MPLSHDIWKNHIEKKTEKRTSINLVCFYLNVLFLSFVGILQL